MADDSGDVKVALRAAGREPAGRAAAAARGSQRVELFELAGPGDRLRRPTPGQVATGPNLVL
jgi:hypothetical protein